MSSRICSSKLATFQERERTSQIFETPYKSWLWDTSGWSRPLEVDEVASTVFMSPSCISSTLSLLHPTAHPTLSLCPSPKQHSSADVIQRSTSSREETKKQTKTGELSAKLNRTHDLQLGAEPWSLAKQRERRCGKLWEWCRLLQLLCHKNNQGRRLCIWVGFCFQKPNKQGCAWTKKE